MPTPAKDPLPERPWAFRGVWLCVALVLSLLGGPLMGQGAAPPPQPIVVGIDEDYPPYEFINPKGQPDGYNVDLIHAVARVMGVSIEIRPGAWGTLRNDLAAGRIQLLTTMLKTPERERTFSFSGFPLIVHYSLFARKDSTAGDGLDALRGHRILVQRGSLMHDLLISKGFQDTLVPVPSELDALRLLAAGQCDAALVARLTGLMLIRQGGVSNIHPVGKPVITKDLCFAVRKDNPELLAKLNNGLAILHNTGEYRQIHEKWFEEPENLQPRFRRVLQGLAILSAVLLVVLASILLWNRTLRQRVLQQTRELRTSKDFLQAVVDSIPLMLFAKDPNRGYAFSLWNRKAEDMTGCKAQLILDTRDEDHFPGEQAGAFRKADEEVMAKSELKVIEEEHLDTPHGQILLRTLKVPIHDQEGKPLQLLGISEDITERKHMEEALRQTQRLESLGVLAGGIAHDFNNLLTAILGNLGLVKEQLEGDHAVQPFLGQAETAVNRAATLARQMLAYSGRGAFLIRRISMNDLIREMANLLQVSIPKKVQTRFELDNRLPDVNGDESQLQQVVMNLVTNAAEAIGDQEGTITLATSQETLGAEEIQKRFPGQNLSPGPFVILQVTDTGCGMAPEVMHKLFEPFFTTKFTGRGLGLAALHGILRGHGGAIHVASECGKGSTFQVYLPALAEEAKPDGPEEATPPVKARTGTILVVEDDAFVRESTLLGLALQGYQVIESGDGAQAVEILRTRSSNISLVLLDLTMPKLNGREVLREMLHICPRMPVVLCSGFQKAEALEGIDAQSVIAFLPKPYSMRSLAAILDKALNPAPGSGGADA